MVDDAATERRRLEHARQETAQQLVGLIRVFDDIVEGSELVNTDDEHDPEGATIAFERAQASALRAAAERRLAALDDALRRLEAGYYGVCARCGGPIGAERLAALPETTICITCATAEASGEP
jgi:DnaK suppressor protein